MNNILHIEEEVSFDESITRIEVHSHQPYIASTFNNSDEIRIPIQNQAVFTLPSQSSIVIEGELLKKDGNPPAAASYLINNGIAHLFDEIRYELNGIEIDRCKNVGITSTIKGYCSFHEGQKRTLENAGWGGGTVITDTKGQFNVLIPLNTILGFAEDYKKVLMNVKQELVLIRSRLDSNAYVTTEDLKLRITKVDWRMPYVYVNDKVRLTFLKKQEKFKHIQIPFRSWSLFEFPLLPTSEKQTWTIKTSSQFEKPRYVILAFQTDRKNQDAKNSSEFDHCNISNVKLYLNSDNYPYENLNLNIKNNRYAILYDMYTQFQRDYYDQDVLPQPLLSKLDFITKAPLTALNCSKQNDNLKTAPVDVKLEFEANENFPDKTTAYCLIIHDRIVEYNTMNSSVKTLV